MVNNFFFALNVSIKSHTIFISSENSTEGASDKNEKVYVIAGGRELDELAIN